MNKVSKSLQRHTFQAEGYIKRCEKEGKEPREDYLNLYKSAREQDEENMVNPEWQQNNLEYDLRSTQWILDKARGSEGYAQNLYAAMCNMQFQKLDVVPILKEELWSCSWRSAGGIVADMREEGDYINWYCSGMGEGLGNGDTSGVKGYVPEGVVTDEIKEDLKQLGWVPVEWKDEHYG
jgi:hypothetical protein